MNNLTKVAAGTLLGAMVVAGCTSGSEGSLPRGETVTEDPSGPGTQSPSTSDSPTVDPTPDEAKDSTSDEAEDPAYPQTADLREVDFPLSPQDAISAAQEEAGAHDLHVISLDFSESRSAWVYEVTLIDGATEWEFDIDAVNGMITDSDSDSSDDGSEVITWGEPMGFAEALELATAEMNEPLRGWSYEYDDGGPRYEFEFGSPHDTVDIKVDAETGRVWRD